jgi:hypothetical protein
MKTITIKLSAKNEKIYKSLPKNIDKQVFMKQFIKNVTDSANRTFPDYAKNVMIYVKELLNGIESRSGQ